MFDNASVLNCTLNLWWISFFHQKFYFTSLFHHLITFYRCHLAVWVSPCMPVQLICGERTCEVMAWEWHQSTLLFVRNSETSNSNMSTYVFLSLFLQFVSLLCLLLHCLNCWNTCMRSWIVNTNTRVFWDMTACSLVDGYHCFKECAAFIFRSEDV
jgi:hypothetical protein